DIIYAPLPLFHGMSRSMGTIPALLMGAQAHLAQRFSASRFWQEVADAKATVAVTIFTIPPTLKALPPTPLDRSHGLRVMFNAHHDREFEERFGVRIVEAHGMTELGLTVYSPYPERHDGAAGRAAPEWEVRVVDEFDRDVPTGEAGEMIVRPREPSIMMKGYWNKPAETAAAQRNLWFHTGDFMRIDNDGYLYFDGRKKERIRCRGENVSAYEVETIVAQHPNVLECAVVAYPAGDGEDDVRLVAIVAEDAGLTEAQLGEWLETRLAKFMLPRYIEFQTSLPKTATGKVEKFRIMETGLPGAHWDRRANMARSPATGNTVETLTADSKP
ncbi:AMP-binding protein, partial [Paraburkholderia sp.]|uniref:AMP-binding protein n=1 Tax=Paraburkholderia sp. TaxID=1926495 RepID=UPI002D6691D3